MAEIRTLTDANWQTEIGDQPALILLTNGDGLRGDFTTQFKKSAQEVNDIFFGQTNPEQNSQLAEQFQAGEKPVLIGYYAGETLVRRVRPWGSDVVLSVELLQQTAKERKTLSVETTDEENKSEAEEPKTMTTPTNDQPVHVTDNDFQEEVIDFSKDMPVLVDFWAEWCGPCRMVAPIMETLAKEFAGKIRVAKVDTDQNPGLGQAFQIRSIPTIMAFKDGHLVFSQPGAFPEAAFRQLVDQLIALDVQAAIAEHEAQQQGEES